VTAVAATVLVVAAAAAAQAQRVTAVWDANTDPYTIGYRLYVGATPTRIDADIDVGNTTSYPVDLPGAGTYYFAVRAYNQSGHLGPASNVASHTIGGGGALLPPVVPAGLSVSVSGNLATLRWSAPATGGAPAGYALFVGTSPGASNVLNGQLLGPSQSVSGSVPPGTYYARLAAYNAAGASAVSAEVTFTVAGPSAPAPPVGVTASVTGATATLSWVPPAPDTGPTAATAYVIEVGTSPGAVNVGRFNVGNVTRFSSAIPVGTYYVRVRAINAFGASAPSSEVVIRYGAPGRPRNLRQSISGSTVTLSWQAPLTGEVTGYIVEAGNGSGLANLLVRNVGNRTTLTTSVPPGTFYVRVRAANGAAVGEASNQIVVRR
jgi:predicted phage tail protein